MPLESWLVKRHPGLMTYYNPSIYIYIQHLHNWVGVFIPLYLQGNRGWSTGHCENLVFSFTKPLPLPLPSGFSRSFSGKFLVVGRQLRQITRKLCQCFVAMNPTLWVSTKSQMPNKQHPKPGERMFLSKNICISWDGKLSHRMMRKVHHWVCNECPTRTAGKIPSCWLHVGGIYSKQHPNKKGHGDMTNIANL